MATSDVELLIKATDQATKQIAAINKGLKKLGDESETTGKKAKKSSTIWEDLQKNWKKIAAGGVAVVATFMAIKKAYDFGKEGAVVKQTTASFKMLLDKVGAAPDLLNKLRKASRGTVDDMTIMKGTALVLAGVTGDLAKNIANATPELMRIAKAANKLNPQLGTTSFMYESIATGVKRAQPLILDNLGLTIKVGAANEAMAKSLGKSVEELTAEEKSMAILNDTLRAGKVLIEQVGGSTEALTDDYEKLGAATTNYTNELKKYASGMGGAGVAVGGYMNMTAQLRQEWEKGNITQAEGLLLIAEVAVTSKTATDVIDGLSEAVVNTTVTNENWLLRQEDLIASSGKLRDSTYDLDWEVRRGTKDVKGLSKAYSEDYVNAQNAARESNEKFKLTLGDITAAQIAEGSIRDIEAAYEDGSIDADTYKGLMSDIMLNVLGMTQAQVDASIAFHDWEGAMESANVDLAEGVELAKNVAKYMHNIPNKKEITIKFNIKTSGKIPKLGGSDKTAIEAYGGQHGLDMTVPPGYSESGGRPFLFAAESGERVKIITEEQQSTIYNFNLTANYEERNRSSLAQDIKMLATVYG